MLVKSTTRHVHIFAAALVDGELEANETDLTLDVDPDNELNWTDGALRKVYAKFEALVAEYSGADLTDYTLRRIGSDLEHFIRSLLQAGEVTYNLNHRALNYSMGLPQIVPIGDPSTAKPSDTPENTPENTPESTAGEL